MQDSGKTVTQHVNWLKLILTFVGIIAISIGLAYLIDYLIGHFHWPIYRHLWLACLVVFVTSVLFNLTVLVPVPFAAVIMVTAALHWNPVLIALCASVGGTLGELSGYYAGYLEKKFAIPDNLPWYEKVRSWINKYGAWAIAFLALQPVIPFDIGGLLAGVAKMPLYKFLPALFLGKFPKYILICYSMSGVINFLPFLFK